VSLFAGGGPLSPQPAGRFNRPVPPDLIYVEPFPRRIRGLTDGAVVVDSEHVLLVHQAGQPPTYAFPVADVYQDVGEAVPEAPGHVRIDRQRVAEWYEEDERVVGPPRNPYHRVDCVPTSRRLRVEVGGAVLVDTTDTMGVYETSLAPRLYVAPASVRTDLLVPSTTTTFCPYKGTASHWSAVVDGVVVDDVAWSYDDPQPACLPIAGFLSFYEDRSALTTDLPTW
jgi:uncharacterized protein (DUF427 family)